MKKSELDKYYKESKEFTDIVSKRFFIIMASYTCISFLPTFIFIDITPEPYNMLMFFGSLTFTILGIFLTPWTYRKIFIKNL